MEDAVAVCFFIRRRPVASVSFEGPGQHSGAKRSRFARQTPTSCPARESKANALPPGSRGGEPLHERTSQLLDARRPASHHGIHAVIVVPTSRSARTIIVVVIGED